MSHHRTIVFATVGVVLAIARIAWPCDTWVALHDVTSGGPTILAKNSDRPPFDCQPLVFGPRQTWPEGTVINLGRLAIPQVRETYATLGSSPYWCWGYGQGLSTGLAERDGVAAVAQLAGRQSVSDGSDWRRYRGKKALDRRA